MTLLIKMPTRQRRRQFMNVLDKYCDLLSGKHDVKFVISMDSDDREMNCSKVTKWLDAKKNLRYFYGKNRTKMQAINANMEHAGKFDILLLASDDMFPQVKGYDDIICTKMQKYFPDLFGALHFNDGRVGNRLNTLSIMGKKMYDYFGYIYHPDYKSVWCDNEFHEVTTQMNKVVYIDKVIIKHNWGGANGDKLYRRNENLYGRDKIVFLKRQSMGFPSGSVM